jgi:hypothetical protein
MNEDSPAPERLPHPDPEIEALLDFTPVHRRTRRHDGWPAEVQRGFIAELAQCGSPGKAAHAVGRTMSGAYKVRTAGGAESFAEAWDKAVDLFLERNPRVPLTGRWRPSDGKAASPRQPEPAPEPELDEDALWQSLCDSIFMKYLLKLDAEREARLAGRIVEADLYVRQLTWLEVTLDLAGLGERAVEMFKNLERGGRHAGQISATPVSLVLDQLRRSYWQRAGGPDRPPLAPLGQHDDEVATGQPPECQHWPERDGDRFGPTARHQEHLRRNAEAQQAWEEKAKADAEAWRKRVEGDGQEAC